MLPFLEIMYKMYKSMVYYYSMPKFALLQNICF